MEDMARVWPILVQFGVGGILSAIGVWAGISSGYLDLKVAEDRRVLWMIVGGYVGLLLLASAFTFWLPYLPAEAAAP